MPPKGIPSYGPSYMGTTHMIASTHNLATLAGYRMLELGGNAVDAGVASGIALNVTTPHLTSLAGVAPIVFYQADTGEVVTISGLGRWPKATNLEEYTKRYNGEIPLGIQRTVVPAACDAWLTALERYGTMTFEQVAAPALELAERGFPASYTLTRSLGRLRDFIVEECPSTAEILMPDGNPPGHGQLIVQKDLAAVLRRMAEVERSSAQKGRGGAIRVARDFFYKGEIAETIVRFHQERDGLLSMEDLAEFSVEVEKPEVGTYKDYTLYTCGPWCQGPALIEVLQILEGFDLKAMGHNSAQYIHTLAEAIKLAFADRHDYFGDPDFVEVPMAGLLSKGYAADRRAALNSDKAWPDMPPSGDPWRYAGKERARSPVPAVPRSGPKHSDTAYTCVVDRWGNAFSATPSDAVDWTPVVPGLGFTVSGRGAQSWLDPEHPSCLGPWKRPRLTPNPAIAFKDGHPFMPFGTPGGDMQIQAMVQMFLSIVEFGLSPQQAIEEPRFRSDSFPDSVWPHAYFPGLLSLESRVDKEASDKLSKLGHEVMWMEDFDRRLGALCGIVIDRERGILSGGADPRADSYVLGR